MKKKVIKHSTSWMERCLQWKVAWLFVFAIFIIVLFAFYFGPLLSPAPPTLCSSADEKALYNQGRDGFSVKIWTKANGEQTFTAMLGNKLLRAWNESESFYALAGGGPKSDLSYKIVEKCGGVDMVYTLKNNIQEKTSNFKFVQIEGIQQSITGDLQYLYPKDRGNLVDMANPDGTINHEYMGLIDKDQMTWPDNAYSPVIVSVDKNPGKFAAGSSIMYPALEYNHTVIMLLNQSNPKLFGESWTHTYYAFNDDKTGANSRLVPGETRTYTVSLRFAKSQSSYWLFTLYPYKQYFNSLYGKYKRFTIRDLTPIRHLAFSDPSLVNQTNPRGYTHSYLDSADYRVFETGWQPVVDGMIAAFKAKGYTRYTIWTGSGSYSLDKKYCYIVDSDAGCNLPPQHMNFMPGTKIEDISMFNKLLQAGIRGGFLWGRHAFVPMDKDNKIITDGTWPPHHLVLANLSDPDQEAYRLDQLNKSLAAGSSIIEFDFFHGSQPYSDVWIWLNKMTDYSKKNYNRDIIFVAEASASDIFHTKMYNFESPCRHKGLPQGPDLLSWYLNPTSDNWIIFNNKGKEGNELCDPNYNGENLTEMIKHANWGFSTLIGGGSVDSDDIPNITGVAFVYSQCMDGRDNEKTKDGLKDFPADPQCKSFMDNDESK